MIRRINITMSLHAGESLEYGETTWYLLIFISINRDTSIIQTMVLNNETQQLYYDNNKFALWPSSSPLVAQLQEIQEDGCCRLQLGIRRCQVFPLQGLTTWMTSDNITLITRHQNTWFCTPEESWSEPRRFMHILIHHPVWSGEK
jgi:hypothetical protein